MRLGTQLVVLAVLFPVAALAEIPEDGSQAMGEEVAKGPVQVCGEMVQAARDGNLDGIVARTSEFGRAKFGWMQRLALKIGRNRIARAKCLDVKLDPGGETALVELSSPEASKTHMPFVHERGFWRFDLKRWKELRAAGQAPMP